MKLYFSPGACSLSPHIVARELGIDFSLEKVDIRAKKTETGRDFWEINPKGYIPVLELENGEVLTEGPAIVQYLADQKPAAKLAPANGTLERSRLQEMLGFINSELHKTFTPLFNPELPADQRKDKEAYLGKRFALIEKTLAKGPYLFGEQFSVADAYLFTVANWSNFVKYDLSAFPNLLAFQRRVAERPAVKAALKAEGLLKD
jgi:glutathione S-transferase